MKKNAFTMIELVFVIVVLGILAAVAVPRFAVSRGDAQVSKGRATVASIRSGIISERQIRLFQGNPAFTATLDANDGQLFSTILNYPLVGQAGAGNWQQTAALTYTYTVSVSNNAPAGAAAFTYVPGTGIFDCVGVAGSVCAALTD